MALSTPPCTVRSACRSPSMFKRATLTRPATGSLKMPVVTTRSFQTTSRGIPTFTEISFITTSEESGSTDQNNDAKEHDLKSYSLAIEHSRVRRVKLLGSTGDWTIFSRVKDRPFLLSTGNCQC